MEYRAVSYTHLTDAASITFNVPTIVTAGIVTLLVALVILGGIKRISSVSEKVVPLMAGLYILGVLIVIAFNLDRVPHAVSIIICLLYTSRCV